MAIRIPIDPSGAVASRYLERPAEKLVVEGLRRWMQGCERGSIDCWERAANLYSEELGITEGARALVALAHWVDTLRNWMDRPAGLSPSECPHLCRDECFAVTLIAACQNHDDESLGQALSRLVPPGGRDDVVRATQAFADALAATGQILIPVPGAVIQEIGTRPCRRQFH